MIQGLSSLTEYLEPPIYSWFTAFTTWSESRDIINGALCHPSGEPEYCDCPTIPAPDEMPFPERVQLFLNVSIDSTCCQKAGFCGAQYSSDVRFAEVNGKMTILSSRLRTQHTALRNQEEYIAAMLHTQKAVEILSTTIPQLKDPPRIEGEPDPAPGGAAYPYSLFYVYYEQYSYIQGVAIQNILAAVCTSWVCSCAAVYATAMLTARASCSGAVFFATLMVSNLTTALVVAVCVVCIVIDLVGWVWVLNPKSGSVLEGDYGVQINAVSVVNLVRSRCVCVGGVAVWRCAHTMDGRRSWRLGWLSSFACTSPRPSQSRSAHVTSEPRQPWLKWVPVSSPASPSPSSLACWYLRGRRLGCSSCTTSACTWGSSCWVPSTASCSAPSCCRSLAHSQYVRHIGLGFRGVCVLSTAHLRVACRVLERTTPNASMSCRPQ